METQTTEQMPRKKNVYNKERYEQNKEEILKYRRERYRTIHKKDLNIKVSTGTFTLYFDWIIFIYYIYIIIIIVIILESKKKVEKKVGRLWEAREATPQSIHNKK